MNKNIGKDLIERVKNLRGNEREIVAELVSVLSTIYRERLYLEAGYPSLFTFCVKALGYSEGAAWRRVSAAKAMQTSPEIYQKLKNGELTLYAAAELSKVVTEANSSELLERAKGCTKKEVHSLLCDYLPPDKGTKIQERVRVKRVAELKPALFAKADPTSPEKSAPQSYTVTLQLSQEEMDLINEAQEVLSTAKVKDTLLKSAKRVVRQHKNLQSKRDKRVASKDNAEQSPTPVKVEVTKKRSRYVPADVRHAVERRDGGRCSYISPGGVRCCERRGLELDHITPFSLGGGSTADNLRLVCKGHNLMYAKQVFGREVIEGIIGYRSERNAG